MNFVRRGVALALSLMPSIALAQTRAPATMDHEHGAIRAALAQQSLVASPTADGLTIDQAVAEASEHNLGLIAERFNVTISEARLVTARLRPNPVLSVEGSR